MRRGGASWSGTSAPLSAWYNDPLMEHPYPILEFDPTRTALIEPKHLNHNIDMPERAVVCFFQDAIGTLLREHDATLLGLHP